ncbi:gliding motility lipoprotein GldH [Sphingobacteriaceae bacterium WQ 2009]|uniref:Gliding motility lipoprotein GldH n=1 Tax=Rhinopithecimicrobium faecis TaxID=2820698 RepID=A0A8T4HD11_9SPHI|nr:gliding motility lipoprotein GldH [Sphingobacteriaceae bacterium WQ 2009]
MKIYHALCSLLLLTLGTACDNDHTTLLDKNESITNRAWLTTDTKSFTIAIKDPSKSYRIYLNLRHTALFPYSNIHLKLKQVNPDKQENSLNTEIKLADKDGRWIGKSAGSLYAQQQLIYEDYRFPSQGIYTFSVQQLMHDNPLKEVVDVGLTLKINP